MHRQTRPDSPGATAKCVVRSGWLRILPGVAGNTAGLRRPMAGQTTLMIERLEERCVMDADSHNTFTTSVHARLNIFVEGQRIVIPKDVGVGAGLSAPVHTHDPSGKLHVAQLEATYPLSPPNRFATLGDFFDAWRNHGGNAGNNPSATFNSMNILGHQADANHVIRFFVNGSPNAAFENYILRDNDDIAILYDTIQASASINGPVLMPVDNYYTTTQTASVVSWGRSDRVELLSGSPLFLPLDGYDPNGQAITYHVSSDNPNVQAVLPSGNRSLRVHVANYGTMLFQLFDDKTPRVTNHIAQLAQSGFYNNVTFHRVIDNFVIQGGDPTGTGSGGSTLGDFDDQFHVDLQHNRTGMLSMAKSSDDTNDSQFFITDEATRSLDFNHSIFGMLTQGDFVRDQINSVATSSSDKPLVNVVMDAVSVVNDQENGLLLLKADAGYEGTANVTVIARDADGNAMSRTFLVNVTRDVVDGGPFLNDFEANYVTPHNTAVAGQLTSSDVENSPVYYDAAPASNGSTFDLDHATGKWTFTPQIGFAGVFSQLVGVRPVTPSGTGQGFDFDIEELLFTVNDAGVARIGQQFTLNLQTPEESSYSTSTASGYRLVASPSGMTIDRVTGVISWTPNDSQRGKAFEIEVSATDSIATRANHRVLRISLRTPQSADFNGDGFEDRQDIALLMRSFGSFSGATASMGDLDGDGRVGISDLLHAQNQFDIIDPSGDTVFDRRDLAIVSRNFGRRANARLADGDVTRDGQVDLADILFVQRRLAQQSVAPGSALIAARRSPKRGIAVDLAVSNPAASPRSTLSSRGERTPAATATIQVLRSTLLRVSSVDAALTLTRASLPNGPTDSRARI